MLKIQVSGLLLVDFKNNVFYKTSQILAMFCVSLYMLSCNIKASYI